MAFCAFCGESTGAAREGVFARSLRLKGLPYSGVGNEFEEGVFQTLILNENRLMISRDRCFYCTTDSPGFIREVDLRDT